MKPIRHKFVEAGLVGKKFTEKAPDMPLVRLNYTFAPDGTWLFDWKSKEDTGEIVITYKDIETGFQALADPHYDYMKAFAEGAFKIPPAGIEDALRMAPLMPEMQKFFQEAIQDTERKFNIKLPEYEYKEIEAEYSKEEEKPEKIVIDRVVRREAEEEADTRAAPKKKTKSTLTKT